MTSLSLLAGRTVHSLFQTSGSYNSLLKIGDVSPVHDGNYTCHAHNLAATVSYTVELHVDGELFNTLLLVLV